MLVGIGPVVGYVRWKAIGINTFPDNRVVDAGAFVV